MDMLWYLRAFLADTDVLYRNHLCRNKNKVFFVSEIVIKFRFGVDADAIPTTDEIFLRTNTVDKLTALVACKYHI